MADSHSSGVAPESEGHLALMVAYIELVRALAARGLVDAPALARTLTEAGDALEARHLVKSTRTILYSIAASFKEPTGG